MLEMLFLLTGGVITFYGFFLLLHWVIFGKDD